VFLVRRIITLSYSFLAVDIQPGVAEFFRGFGAMVGWDKRKSCWLLHWIESVNFGLILGRTFLGRIEKRESL
jgi:hypothetical protein